MVAPTDHGQWSMYIPATIPPDVPANAMFLKRQGDDQDWYAYVHAGTNFDAISVKFVVYLNASNSLTMIRAPAMDPTMLFPDGAQVVEMLGDYSSYTTNDLINQFANKVIDLTTGDITDPPPPAARTGA